MLGWHISVYRQKDGGAQAAMFESPPGTRLAVWQTGLHGLDWLQQLVATGKAFDLGGSDYPCRYTAPAEHLIPYLSENPPGALKNWITGAGDVATDKWVGKTLIDGNAVGKCRPQEWLLVEAWDES